MTKTPRTDETARRSNTLIASLAIHEYDHLARQLETKLNELAAAAGHYLDNSIPSADHMAEWHKLKDALAAMPNEKLKHGND
jgi:hypothetical protein